MNDKGTLREQLITSLRVFLFLETYAPRDIDPDQPICEIKMNEEEYLNETLVGISITRWQIHHAYSLDHPDLSSLSMSELADLALASQQLVGHDYQTFVNEKMIEISKLLHEHVQNSNREQAVIEKAEYLMNLN